MPEATDSGFAAVLRRLRTERDMSLRELARVAYYGKSYLHELETGVKQPTPQAARRLDDALGAGGELVAMAATGMRRREVIARAGLAVALPQTILSHGRRVGAEVPHQIAARTARLRRLDDYLGGADTFAMYAAELDSTLRLLRDGSYPDTTGRALLSVFAEQAQMAGWAAFDAGRYGDAEQMYRTSLAVAHDAGNPSLAGNAMVFLAYQELALGRSGTDTIAAACDIAEAAATPAVRALLHLRRAWIHAVNGQADDTERLLALAETCLTEQDDRPEPDWVYWVDRREAEIMTGRCWAVLRRPVRAIAVLEAVLGRYEDTHARDKALYLSWLADAYLDANEVEQGCTVAERAVRLSADVGSIRPGQRIEAFVGRLGPYTAMPCVTRLRGLVSDQTRRRRTRTANSDRPEIPPRSG
ncbi:helix-turn-helix domain-containing protein [Plantactinospora soyae]|uniref:Transcriptional regulator with XRE-family HTH domain n=1 Tax=Plantactinospora soyae TaxID=1544732 RepID=A0A927M1R9_9ACTN|nr:helix-turn-helix domain-containing protein [Plantactinospora soyae]MBE1485232.1 transcriptional regulator with XRE-family HTH domain [Plantactinospora soyae]